MDCLKILCFIVASLFMSGSQPAQKTWISIFKLKSDSTSFKHNDTPAVILPAAKTQ